MTTFQTQTPSGPFALEVVAGHPLFIIGRNGTGKSALVNRLYAQASTKAIYLPGSRTALFDAEGFNLTTAGRRNLTQSLMNFDRSPDTRFKNVYGNNVRNEKALYDLTAAEIQYKADLANQIASKVDVAAATLKLQEKSSPLDRVNLLLEQANLTVRIVLSGGELLASSGGSTYSFARMSDGERTALILICEVIAATDQSLLVIDEPELHLHPSIVVPLIAALIRSRRSCEFVISTHELLLPSAVRGARVCIVRGAQWNSGGEIQSWTLDLIDNPDDIPEDVRVDLLGSRHRVLFTEGKDESLDIPIYSILFPGVSVRPKGGCREVQRAVAGTRSTASLHRSEGFGLIDNDGMSAQQIAENQAAHIYPLPMFSVESLYYDRDVVAAIAARQAETLATDEEARAVLAAQLIAAATTGVIAEAGKVGVAENLAGILAERRVRDELTSKLPKKKDLATLTTPDVSISTTSPYPTELAKFNALRSANDAYGLIARYNVRSSGMLKAVAEALRFPDRGDYEAAVRSRLSSDEALRITLSAKLEPLTTVLTV